MKRSQISYLRRLHDIDERDDCHRKNKRVQGYSILNKMFLSCFICDVEDDAATTACEQDDPTMIPMRGAIEDRRYDIVRTNLRQKCDPDDPNEEIAFRSVYMTGLEYSIYTGDWKMATLFFLNSADPTYNCFDGTILKSTPSHYHSISDVDLRERSCRVYSHPAFAKVLRQRRKGRGYNQISGFDGLYCLANSDHAESDQVMSSLWLMKNCYDCNISPLKPMRALVKITRKHIFTIGRQDIWYSRFEKKVHTILLCLRFRMDKGRKKREIRSTNIPNEVAIHILEFIMDDILNDVIHNSLRITTERAIANVGGF